MKAKKALSPSASSVFAVTKSPYPFSSSAAFSLFTLGLQRAIKARCFPLDLPCNQLQVSFAWAKIIPAQRRQCTRIPCLYPSLLSPSGCCFVAPSSPCPLDGQATELQMLFQTSPVSPVPACLGSHPRALAVHHNPLVSILTLHGHTAQLTLVLSSPNFPAWPSPFLALLILPAKEQPAPSWCMQKQVSPGHLFPLEAQSCSSALLQGHPCPREPFPMGVCPCWPGRPLLPPPCAPRRALSRWCCPAD